MQATKKELPSSTYARLTADKILEHLDLSLSDDELNKLLHHNDSFYKKLLQPFREHIINQHIYDYCESLDEYYKNELDNINITYKKFCQNQGISEDPSSPTKTAIDEAKTKLDSLTANKNKLSEKNKETFNKIKTTMKKFVTDWEKMQSEAAQQITESLQSEGYSLPDNFQELLKQRLEKQITDLKQIPSEASELFDITKPTPSFVEKAIIKTLFEDSIDV